MMMKVKKWVIILFSVLAVAQFTVAQIAITEFLNDPLGSDTDLGREYVEFFNYSGADVDLMDWIIKDEDNNNLTVTSTSTIIPSGGFLLFASGKSAIEADWFGGVPDDRIIEYGGPNSETMELSNSGDELLLINASGDTVWVIAYANDDLWDTLGTGDDGYNTYLEYSVDFTTYPSRWGTKALPGIVRNGFDAGLTVNDTTATGADTTYIDSVLGYEGGAFTRDYLARLSLNGDSGSPLAGYYSQVSGKKRSNAQIAITEFLNDPLGADTDTGREYVELFNYGGVSVDIQNWTLKDEDHHTLGYNDWIVITTDPITIPSGGYLLFASSKDTIEAEYFAGVADDRIIEYGGPSSLNMQLSNSSDELMILDAAGDTVWNMAYSNDDAYDGSTDDGFSTYLDYATDFSSVTTDWGHKGAAGVVRNGADTLVAGAPLGYEGGAFTLDSQFLVSLNGDMGSPLAGTYLNIVSIDAEEIFPEALSLIQNYPNPFNPSTTIRFSLQIRSDAQMVIFDITGRTIKTVEMPSMSAGQHEYIWDGRNAQGQIVSTGVYFCRLQTTGYSTGAIKMIYLK
jgi:hypothetical protein